MPHAQEAGTWLRGSSSVLPWEEGEAFWKSRICLQSVRVQQVGVPGRGWGGWAEAPKDHRKALKVNRS